MAGVAKLTPDVVEHLRSSIALTSQAQAIEELVLNSVDAGATMIQVNVDPAKWYFQVTDNGQGITPEDLKTVGERYATSKCHSLADLKNVSSYGFRGEAICSIASLSLLEITTRSSASFETMTKTFQAGRVLRITKADHHRPPGTTITVRDFFFNMPVRRRRLTPASELEKIKRTMERIALIHPLITFSLFDAGRGTKHLQTKKASPTLSTPSPPAPTSLSLLLSASFAHLFGVHKAGVLKSVYRTDSDSSLNANICADDLSTASVAPRFLLEGMLSMPGTGHPSKALQFLYINKRYVKKTPLHKLINNRYTKCLAHTLPTSTSAAATSGPTKPSTRPPPSGESTTPNTAGTAEARRNFEKYPMFVLNLTCSPQCYDITYDPKKSLVEFRDWDPVLKLFDAVVDDVLMSAPALESTVSISSSSAPALMDIAESSADAVNNSDSSPESRTKRKREESAGDSPGCHSNGSPDGEPHNTIGHSEDNEPLRPSKRARSTSPHYESGLHCISCQEESTNELPSVLEESHYGESTVEADLESSVPLTASPPLFVEKRIGPRRRGVDTASTSTAETRAVSTEPSVPVVVSTPSAGTAFDSFAITKDIVKSLKVINQVDKKFIIARHGRTLYVLDQHAVDERIRLEKFQAELPDTLDTVAVDEHMRVTPRERRLLELYREAIETWGFKFEVVASVRNCETADGTTEVRLVRVPVVMDTRLTADNLREFAEQLDAAKGARTTRPRAIGRVLNNKACRGAIMFGDPLTKQEATGLVHQLAACKLPFQCAHGRPSITPLVDLGKVPTRRSVVDRCATASMYGWRAAKQTG